MKNFILSLLFVITTIGVFAQTTKPAEDCRTKIEFNGYNLDSGYYQATITNKMDMATKYVVEYPGGSFITGYIYPANSTHSLIIRAPKDCGYISVKPTDSCHYTCPLDFVQATKNTCDVLATKVVLSNVNKSADGKRITGYFTVSDVTNIKSFTVEVKIGNRIFTPVVTGTGSQLKPGIAYPFDTPLK